MEPNLEPNLEPNFTAQNEPSLVELLDTALGSGELAGAVNFISLKSILESILQRLSISSDVPKHLPPTESNYYDVKNRIENLERMIQDLTRPRSPNTLITDSQNGSECIKSDWEVTKLRKRVDANEEGVTKALAILDQLVNQIQEVKNDVNETKERLETEQKAQDEEIVQNKSAIKELNERLSALVAAQSNQPDAAPIIATPAPADHSEELFKKLDEVERRLRTHDADLRTCVNWDKLNNSFMLDFFNEDGEDQCETERQGYSYYFNGLQTLSELGTKIDEMLRLDGGSAATSLSSIKTPKNKHSSLRILESYNVPISDGRSRTVILAEQKSVVAGNEDAINVSTLLKENDQLRHDLEQLRSGGKSDPTTTDSDGQSPPDRRKSRKYSVFSRKSIADGGSIPSLVGLDERIRECEVFVDHAQLSFDDHDIALDQQTEKIEALLKLKANMDNILADMAEMNRFMEANGKKTDEEDGESYKKLQKKLSGTERELARLADVINGLSSDGDQKNRELDELQSLLRDLQDRAAMRDTVMDDLGKKANTEDLDGMLQRDELDATAQAIVNQLQDVINKQAVTEAQLQSSINQVGEEMQGCTAKDEFDPFKSEIELRLRQLRKKIESSKKEQDGLTTAEGAAGFRRQLFNCISCNNNLNLTAMRPILPEPSAFPARISLRPHFGQAPAHHFFYSQLVAESQSRPKSAYATSPCGDNDNTEDSDQPRTSHSVMREHTSHYGTLLAEKERERRRKYIENKIRQECNPYSFQSGIFPRQAGNHTNKNPGYLQSPKPEPVCVQKSKEDTYERLRRTKSLQLNIEADLEGTDGHLYKGQVRKSKLPSLKPKDGGSRVSPDPALSISNTLKNDK